MRDPIINHPCEQAPTIIQNNSGDTQFLDSPDAEQSDDRRSMKRKHPSEWPGFELDRKSITKAFFGQSAEKPEFRSVKTPFDQLQPAMPLGQVSEVPVIPRLKMPFVHLGEMDLMIEQRMELSQVGHGHNYEASSNQR
jgi:hypothetical protein